MILIGVCLACLMFIGFQVAFSSVVDDNTGPPAIQKALVVESPSPMEDPLFKSPYEIPSLKRSQRNIELTRPRMRKKRPEEVILPLRAEGDTDPPLQLLSFLKRTPISASMTAFGSSETNRSSSTITNPTTTSIFDCERENGKCRYFYPSHFFTDPNVINSDTKHGKGSKFYYILEEMESLLQQRKLWIAMPYTGLWTMSFDQDQINPLTSQPFPQQNVTFLHVHKTGGTTIVKHANSRISSITGRVMQHFKVYMFQWIANGMGNPNNNNLRGDPRAPPKGMMGQRDKTQMFQMTLDHLAHATKYKSNNNWTARDHLLFGVVRDPTDRFISMIGQAFGAQGSSRNGGAAEELKRDCLNSETYTLEASRFTIQCVIDKIKEKGYFMEIHFTPQAVEVAFSTQMINNLPVALFPFSELQVLLTEIGCDPDNRAKDGGGRFRPSPILQSMSVDDYSPDLIKQICELYEVDVIMLRTLGWGVPRCDPYIAAIEDKI